MSRIAAVVAEKKRLRPADYCPAKNCLWRVQTRKGVVPCPRHPQPTKPADAPKVQP